MKIIDKKIENYITAPSGGFVGISNGKVVPGTHIPLKKWRNMCDWLEGKESQNATTNRTDVKKS